MFKQVLLRHDGSEQSRGAWRGAANLDIQLNAKVYVLSIVPSGQGHKMCPWLIGLGAAF